MIKQRVLQLFLIAMLMVLPCFGMTEERGESILVDPSANLYQMGGYPETHLTSRAANVTKAKAALYKVLANSENMIDLTSYGISGDDFYALYCDVVNSHYDLFYCGKYIVYINGDGTVGEVYPRYTCTGAELASRKEKYYAELNRIADYAAPATTPLMKALMVNDYFCINYRYDTTYTIYDAYTFFTQKTGVCEAYSLAYAAALSYLGVYAKTVISRAMNHMWNLVQLDGEWYHVDVTGNDPVPDTPGHAGHYFFMCSDVGLEDHYDWVAEDGITCTSTKYDHAIWNNYDVPLAVCEDSIYIITGENNHFALTRWYENTMTDVYSYEATWYNTYGGILDGYAYPKNYSGIGVYQQYLLFNTYQDVYAYSVVDGSLTKLYTVPDSKLGIWASTYRGNVLTASFGTTPFVITSVETINLTFPAPNTSVLPDDTTSIASGAFEGTAVEHVVCGSRLKTIGSRAFARCSELRTIELGSSVTKIAEDAFTGCSSSLVFICPANSYAAGYAAVHGFAVKDK